MCGIFGFLVSKRNINKLNLENLLKDSCKSLAHRGPDGAGTYLHHNSNYSIGLAHTRLSIIDLSESSNQPMFSHDKKISITYNGEIYNFLELKKILKDKGYIFQNSSDTEVLINLYLEFGIDMLTKINGIFAFGIWDQDKKTLFLARDSFGVKPIFFNIQNNEYFFSSEIKALVNLRNISSSLNNKIFENYLTYIWSPGEETPFQNIKSFKPGEAMLVKEGKILKKWIYSYLPVFKKKISKKMSSRDAVYGVKKYLNESVSKQVISDAPIGAFLSGGLDSSAIVASAQKFIPNLKCFTIDIEDGNERGTVDDLYYAKKVANKLNVSLETIKINSSRMANDIEFMIKSLDEPIADPAALNVYYISRAAKEQGIKVLLSGTGGDDIFTGYRRHYAYLNDYLLNWLPNSFKSILQKTSGMFSQNYVLTRRINKLLSGIDLNNNERLLNYFRWIQREDLKKLYTPEFNQLIKDSDPSIEMQDFLNDLPMQTSKLDQMLGLEQRYFLPDHNLLYTDRMSMAAGVEVRVPFLDKDLVE